MQKPFVKYFFLSALVGLPLATLFITAFLNQLCGTGCKEGGTGLVIIPAIFFITLIVVMFVLRFISDKPMSLKILLYLLLIIVPMVLITMLPPDPQKDYIPVVPVN
ncbi:hypothetical protein KW782_03630 [Candidatus Parcubacteria bacterium]|nr:hypothetical protein [Candidatus Parcubacteria bacterium]